MTATEPVMTDTLIQHVLAAAEAARGAIAGAGEWTIEEAGDDSAVPAPASRAVQTQLGAATLILVCDPDLARHLQVGPPPAEDLLEGATPAIGAAVAALADVLDGAEASEVSELDPNNGLPVGGRELVAARLVADGAHRATLVLAVPVAAPTATVEEAVRFEEVQPTRLSAVPTGLELLHDVEMGVTAELGRTRMLVREVLELQPGSVIELDRAAGSPVDVLVNGTLIARGEVVVIDEEFGIRIVEVIGYEEGRSR